MLHETIQLVERTVIVGHGRKVGFCNESGKALGNLPPGDLQQASQLWDTKLSEFSKVTTLSQLEEQTVVAAKIGDVALIVFRDGETLRALQRYCIHQGADLSEGLISRGHLICPVHAWRFSTKTGEHDRSPENCLKSYRVKVEGQDVFVDPTPLPR